MKRFALIFFFSFQACASTPDLLGVVNKADGTASFLNPKTGATVLTATAGFLPHEIAASSDGRYAFVSNYGKDHVRSEAPTNKPGNTLTVIDLALGLTSADIQLDEPAPCAPHGMVPSRDGRYLYVTCEMRDEVSIIDLNTARVVGRIPTGQAQSHMLVVSYDGRRGYTSNFAGGSISVLDLETRQLLGVVKTGAGTEGVAVSPDGLYAYATSVLENKLFKIDSETFEIMGVVDTCRSPVRVTALPAGNLIVNCSADGVARLYDSGDLKLLKQVALGRQPIGVAIGKDKAYFANMKDNSVAIVDLQKFEVEGFLPTGRKPDGLTFIPRR
jgi:YVTN family beta-propeller protein